MSRLRARACIALILFFSAPGFTTSALAAVGRTAGSAEVTKSGAFAYHIPIWSPPGVRGIAPHLSLDYNSQAGPGMLGVGWSLGGLSSITRCNRTVAQDGAAATITLSYLDGYCIDGKHLQLTSGQYGQAGSTYKTELEDFSNITLEDVVGDSPAWFLVQGRNGLLYEYGYEGNSQALANNTGAPVEWRLDKVFDRSNNTMLITYQAASQDGSLMGMTVPASISWTSTSQSAGTYSIQFKYQVLSSALVAGYVAGGPVQSSYLLKNIYVQSSGTTIKNYVLGYTISATTKQTLTSVQECTDEALTDCLAATNMTYQTGSAPGLATGPNTLPFGSSAGDVYTAFDLNGDGISDLIWRPVGGADLQVAFGIAGGGYTAPTLVGIPTAQWDFVGVGDIDGSGVNGILVAQVNPCKYGLYRWNGSSFASVSTTMLNAAGAYAAQAVACPTPTVFTDVDGDGRAEIVQFPSRYVVNVWWNNGAGQVYFQGAAYTQFGGLPVGNLAASTTDSKRFDFTGDGQGDFVGLSAANSIQGFHLAADFLPFNGFGASRGAYTGFQQVFDIPAPARGALIAIADVNDDGCQDVLFTSVLELSSCSTGTSVPVQLTPGDRAVTALDWDSDGRKDVIAERPNTTGDVTKGVLVVYLSTGTGLAPAMVTNIRYSDSNFIRAIPNAAGDGLDGLLIGDYSSNFKYYLHSGGGRQQDLLSSVSDGFGISSAPTYTSIELGSFTRSTGAVYPETDWSGPLYVVKGLTASDGIGGTYTRTYSYSGARTNVQGIGFEGFSSIAVADSRSGGSIRKSNFLTAFPLSGMISEDDLYQSDGTTLIAKSSYTNSALNLKSASGSRSYFPYVSASTAQRYEVGGSKNGKLIATTTTSYTYDNFGNATNVVTTVTDNDATSALVGQQWVTNAVTSITPDTSTHWCLNLPTQTTVTNSGPGTPSITRTVAYTPDYALCREQEKITEPGSATYRVSESYAFDTFGNIRGTTVQAANMPARSSSADWGSTGQFPISTTNALNETTLLGYDSRFGLPTSQTDPNGILTKSHYDTFGRIDTQTAADGTKVVFTYSDCAAGGGCITGNHGTVVTRTLYNADNSVQTDATTYLDQMDRPLVATSRLLGGAYNRTEMRYDSFGRTLKRSIPCLWSSIATSCPYWQTIAYDVLGRPTQMQRPMSSQDQSLQTTTYSYNGDTIVTTDPQQKESTQVTTPVGLPASIQDHDGYAINFSYDGFGSLTKVSDSLGNTLRTQTYDYGLGAFRRTQSDADRGNSTYQYDALGELIAWSDGNNHTYSQQYDVLSRPTVRSAMIGVDNIQLIRTWGTSRVDHNVDKPVSMTGNDCSDTCFVTYEEDYTYDAVGRLLQRSIPTPATGSTTNTCRISPVRTHPISSVEDHAIS